MLDTLSLLVDFNRLDDNDVLWAFRDRASDPSMLTDGVAIRLYDNEGSECLGYILSMDGEIVRARPEFSTWRDTDAVSIVQEDAQVIDLLAALKESVAWHKQRPHGSTEQVTGPEQPLEDYAVAE